MHTPHCVTFMERLESVSTYYKMDDVQKYKRWIGVPEFNTENNSESPESFFISALSWAIDDVQENNIEYITRLGTSKPPQPNEEFSYGDSVYTVLNENHKTPLYPVYSMSLYEDPMTVAKISELVENRDDLVWEIDDDAVLYIYPHSSVTFE